jgi:hypothetical protein
MWQTARGIMHSKNTIALIVIVTLLLLTTSAAVSRPRKMQRLGSGSWGGPHIRIEVETGSARIEYDCANGTINGPLTIDSKGRFTWRGTHQPEGPGPIRIDQERSSSAAVYTGSVKGTTMTLTVTLAGSKEPLGTFTVRQGGGGRVFKCR